MSEEASPAPTPGRCIYGYVLFLASNFALFLYLFYALMPDHILIDLGVTYFPSKYWFIAIPTFTCTLLVTFAFVIYPSINLLITKPLDSISVIKDEFSMVLEQISKGIYLVYSRLFYLNAILLLFSSRNH